jgi:hypothetical protein
LPEFKEKSKQTCLDKYGVEHYTQTKEYRTKRDQTNSKKYGSIFNYNQEMQKKRKKACLERYGVEYVSQLPQNRNTLRNWCSQNPDLLGSDSRNEVEILKWIGSYYSSAKKIRDKLELDICPRAQPRSRT